MPTFKETIERLWATARYDLGLSTAEFYDLTPRQFSLLMDAHKRRLIHAEMIGAFTTAGVINFSFAPPQKPVLPKEFMPNFRAEQEPVPENVQAYSEEEIVDWHARIANLAAEMKAGGGPMLDELNRKIREEQNA